MMNLISHPVVVLLSLALGVVLGLVAPGFSVRLSLVSDAYVDLLRMVVLPFMVSAIIFSLQRLLQQGATGGLVRRTVGVFAAALGASVLIGYAGPLLLGGWHPPTADQVEALGRLIGSADSANDTQVELLGVGALPRADVMQMLRTTLIPSNIFAALAQGDTLKALVFALLFGVAAGRIGLQAGHGLNRGLEAVYLACQQLMKWLNLPLPLVLVCMAASQVAVTGLAPLGAMVGFIADLAFGTVLALVLAVAVLNRRAGQGLKVTLRALQTPVAVALATRSSTACMPSMIEALAGRLGFERNRVELLVPLMTPLLRIGPLLYYMAATVFVARLYDRPLSMGDLVLVGVGSLLAACASAGMTGVLTVSLTGLVCAQVGLPFEAAFVLLMAIDPVCDMLRTVVLVVGNTAAASLAADRSARAVPQPVPETPLATAPGVL